MAEAVGAGAVGADRSTLRRFPLPDTASGRLGGDPGLDREAGDGGASVDSPPDEARSGFGEAAPAR